MRSDWGFNWVFNWFYDANDLLFSFLLFALLWASPDVLVTVSHLTSSLLRVF